MLLYHECLLYHVCFVTGSETGEIKVLTKGDNNHGHDRVLYAKNQYWVSREEIVGRAKGWVEP